MENWTSGYVTEVGYQWGYFSELNPMRAKIALPCSGIACPEIKHACELGFGQGVSLNMHAAGGESVWHGNDFNPSQAFFARELAELKKRAGDFLNKTRPVFSALGIQ